MKKIGRHEYTFLDPIGTKYYRIIPLRNVIRN